MQTSQAEMRAAAKSAHLDCLEDHMTAQALQNTTNNDHETSFSSALIKPQDPERMLCVVCMEREKRVVLLPCKHCCMCKECTDQIVAHWRDQAQCPVCRQLIVDTLEPFY